MVKKTVEIATKNLLLRQITIDDAPAMYNNWASDQEVTKYLSWSTHQNIEETKQVISTWINQYNNDFFFQWVIELKKDQEIIGTISLFNYINNSLEVGFCLSKQYWNQGLTTEVCRAIIDFAFTQVGVNSVKSRHMLKNIASGRVMQKNNMTHIKTTKEYIKKNDELVIMKTYEIKKENFR